MALAICAKRLTQRAHLPRRPLVQVATRASRKSLVCRADFIGSSTNLVSVAAFFAAGRSSAAAAAGHCSIRLPPPPKHTKKTKKIMVASTTAFLAAGRFGLAPTVKNGTNAGLKLSERAQGAGLLSGDPAGFTIVDTLALGALGHVVGTGIVLGLKATGGL